MQPGCLGWPSHAVLCNPTRVRQAAMQLSRLTDAEVYESLLGANDKSAHDKTMYDYAANGHASMGARLLRRGYAEFVQKRPIKSYGYVITSTPPRKSASNFGMTSDSLRVFAR